MRISLNLTLSLLFLALTAGANTETSSADEKAAREVSVQSGRTTLKDLATLNLENELNVSLNALVNEGLSALRDNGYSADADQFQNEWHSLVASAGLMGSLNLGDHQPISQWLANFYDQLETRLTYNICHRSHLDDIKVFNFGIPVTTHPTGMNGDSWSEVEYSKHFVPVTGALVYWSARMACSAAVSGAVSYLCGPAAGLVRAATEKYVAPRLSNYVYEKAQGRNPNSADGDVESLLNESMK